MERLNISRVKKGKIAELLTQVIAIKQGLDVYSEVNGDTKVDLILINPKNYKRYTCQVKCISNPKNTKRGRKLPVRKLTHSKTTHKTHHYSKDNIDFFVGVDVENEEVYVLLMSFVETYRGAIALSVVKENSYSYFPLSELDARNSADEQPKIGESLTANPEPKSEESVNGVETERVAPKSIDIGEETVQTTNG